MTRAYAIKQYCTGCSDGPKDRQDCQFKDCPLWLGRNGKRPTGFQPSKAIRKYCVESCMNGQSVEVRLCPVENCFLYRYRLGYKIVPEDQTSSDIGSPVGLSGLRIESDEPPERQKR
jgi:hypothetical protein